MAIKRKKKEPGMEAAATTTPTARRNLSARVSPDLRARLEILKAQRWGTDPDTSVQSLVIEAVTELLKKHGA